MNCDVVKDLLPLYHDGVCSEESRIEIEKHLKECEGCQKYLKDIEKIVQHYSNKLKEDREKVSVLKVLRKKFFRRRTIIILSSILGAIILLMCAFAFITQYEFVVKYDEALLSKVQHYKNVVDIFYNNDFYQAYVFLKQEGDEVIAYMYYKKYLIKTYNKNYPRVYPENKYTLHYKTIYLWEDEMFLRPSDPYFIDIDTLDNQYDYIKAVYYFVGDYKELSKLSDKGLAETTKDAVLIWEK